jgi:hypothetical protein
MGISDEFVDKFADNLVLTTSTVGATSVADTIVQGASKELLTAVFVTVAIGVRILIERRWHYHKLRKCRQLLARRRAARLNNPGRKAKTRLEA